MSIIAQVSNHKWAAGLVLVAVLLLSVAAFAGLKKVSPAGWGWFGPVNTTAGVAMAGYDPVSAHQGAPVKGDPSLKSEYQGALWYFATASAKALFDAQPQRYAPQFGGFCAFAMSKGFTANPNPEVFVVDGDRLYLFDGDSVRTDYLAERATNIALSEANWSKRGGHD